MESLPRRNSEIAKGKQRRTDRQYQQACLPYQGYLHLSLCSQASSAR
jgi:hypothetical protein